MEPTFKQMTDFFRSVGADGIGHSGKSYLAHAIGVYRDMQAWGGDEDLCRAAMFHSIYGTQKFQKFALPLERRDELKQLIGDQAERLAYWNCLMDRDTFDRAIFQTEGPYRLGNRVTGEPMELNESDFQDLCRLHLCDWLEQVPRSQDWDYRRAAYRQLANRLGGIAQESYDRVFALEAAQT